MKRFGFVVFTVVLNLFVASFSFSSATEELEGTLEIAMFTDVSRKTCEPAYSIIDVKGERTQFSPPARAPFLLPGQKIKIVGRWEESFGKKSFHCRKVTIATAPAVQKTVSPADSAGDYLPRQYPVLNEQKILVICLNSPEDKDSSPVWSEEKIDDKIFSNKHSLNAYWKACSGEKVWLAGDILDRGNWKTMPKNWAEYGYGSDEERQWRDEFITDMIALIDPEVDFSKQYDGLIVFRAGKKWKYDWSTLGKRRLITDEGEVKIATSFLNEYDIEISNDYGAHESGHGLFSLVHAYSVSLSGKIHPYGDRWDNRGWSYGLLDRSHQYELGWLGISQITIVAASGEYWLDQRELESSGAKLLVIPLGFDNMHRPIFIYLEYHRGLGEFDSQLSFSNKNDVDPNNLVLLRKYQFRGFDSLVYVASDDGRDPLDLELKEFCDSDYPNLEHYGVCVQVLEKIGTDAGSQAKVKITLTKDYSFPTPVPPPATPTPTPTPIPTPTPTPTPTPCEAADITSIPSGHLTLKKKTSKEVTVTVTGANGCVVEGATVEAEVTTASGQKRITVSPNKGETDENGQVIFTITAQKKPGKGVVAFWTGNLETLLYVKVSKK